MSSAMGALWWVLMSLSFGLGAWWGSSRERAKRFMADERERNRRATFGDR